MGPRQKTLAVFAVISLALTSTHWMISPPDPRHGVTGAIAFTAIAWALWSFCLAPVWVPYLISRRAVRLRMVLFLASSLLLLVAAAAFVLMYFWGESFVHWGTLTAAAVSLVVAVIQFWQGVGRRAFVTPTT